MNITPTADHPLPKNFQEEVADSLQGNARVAADTASLMFELGMPFEMTAEDEEAARKLFAQVDVKKKKDKTTDKTFIIVMVVIAVIIILIIIYIII